MKTRVRHYDAFASHPGHGNPVGVVLDADGLDESQMQDIARQAKFNASVFVLGSRVADLRLRFFTDSDEIDLCGQATLAAVTALVDEGYIAAQPVPLALRVDTRVGCLPVHIGFAEHGRLDVRMGQTTPRFLAYEGTEQELAECLGIEASDLAPGMPLMYGHTGEWSLLAPLRGLDALRRLQPDYTAFPHVLHELPRASIHAFCLETRLPDMHMHARHFVSPYAGAREDLVTATGCGAMAAYHATFVAPERLTLPRTSVRVAHGGDIGKPGCIEAEVSQRDRHMQVTIQGQAVFVEAFWADPAHQAA